MFPFAVKHTEFFPVPQPAEVLEDVSSLDNGRVKFLGSLWRAKLFPPASQHVLKEGQIVRVIGREGLTLLVQSNTPV